jgi:hypothetical protein
VGLTVFQQLWACKTTLNYSQNKSSQHSQITEIRVGHTDDGTHVIGDAPQVAHQDEQQAV